MVNSNGDNISYKTRLFCSSLLSDKRSRLYFIWCQMGDLWWHYMPSGGRGRGDFLFSGGGGDIVGKNISKLIVVIDPYVW